MSKIETITSKEQLDQSDYKELIHDSLTRIRPYIKNTSIISSSLLNNFLGHEIYFKLETLQKTGSFKIRGILNSLLKLKQQNKKMPKKIVTYSTGNHAIALSWAASNLFSIETEIYLPSFTSEVKRKIVDFYSNKVILTETRAEAEIRASEAAKENGHILIPPSDHDDIITGAGTAAYEVFTEIADIDAIFIPIGGGSLASGTLLAKQSFSPKTKVFAGEPKTANDASISYKTGKIFKFENSPETVADGARTLKISDRIFQYIKQLDGIYEISEREIFYWTNWFTHLTKITCEPTSTLAIAAAYRFLKKQNTKKRVVVIISGGNLNQDTYQKIWAKNYLDVFPNKFNYEEE